MCTVRLFFPVQSIALLFSDDVLAVDLVSIFLFRSIPTMVVVKRACRI